MRARSFAAPALFLLAASCGAATSSSSGLATPSGLDPSMQSLAAACRNRDDASACEQVGDALGHGRGAPRDPKGARAFYEKACDLHAGMCLWLARYSLWGTGEVPADPGLGLALHEVVCIESALDHSACLDLRSRLVKAESIRRDADDWLPLYAEAALPTVHSTPDGICATDPSACPAAQPGVRMPPPAQATAERKRILDDHDARCRQGDLHDCYALVRIDALRLAESVTLDGRNVGAPRRTDPRVAWDRLCRANSAASCLDLGLCARDENALHRACELGEPLGCTRAAGMALARQNGAEAGEWLARACRLGRTWACR